MEKALEYLRKETIRTGDHTDEEGHQIALVTEERAETAVKIAVLEMYIQELKHRIDQQEQKFGIDLPWTKDEMEKSKKELEKLTK